MATSLYDGIVELIKTSFYTEDVTDDVYFKDYTGHVSNSALGLLNYMQGGSPQRYLDGFGDKKTKSLELGTVVHKMVLERDLYTISPVDKPSGKVGDIIDTIYSLTKEGLSQEDAIIEACKINDYYKGNPGEKRIAEIWNVGTEYLNFLRQNNGNALVMTAALKHKLKSCVESINNNKKVNSLLFPKGQECFRELPVFGTALVKLSTVDEELNIETFETIEIPIKAKIDFFSIDRLTNTVTLVDLKTTGKPIATFMGYFANCFNGKYWEPNYVLGSFHTYHYYRQVAFYGDILMAYLNNAGLIDESYKLDIKIAAVETNAPFGSEAIDIDEYSIKEGREEYSKLLRMLGRHMISGFDKTIML